MKNIKETALYVDVPANIDEMTLDNIKSTFTLFIINILSRMKYPNHTLIFLVQNLNTPIINGLKFTEYLREWKEVYNISELSEINVNANVVIPKVSELSAINEYKIINLTPPVRTFSLLYVSRYTV